MILAWRRPCRVRDWTGLFFGRYEVHAEQARKRPASNGIHIGSKRLRQVTAISSQKSAKCAARRRGSHSKPPSPAGTAASAGTATPASARCATAGLPGFGRAIDRLCDLGNRAELCQ